MPPDRPLLLPTSVLAALGLASGVSCGPCLQCLSYGSSDYSGCLCLDNCTSESETDTETGVATDSGDTASGHTGDTGTAARAAPSPLLGRLEGVLPPDVLERLRGR